MGEKTGERSSERGEGDEKIAVRGKKTERGDKKRW